MLALCAFEPWMAGGLLSRDSQMAPDPLTEGFPALGARVKAE